MKKIIPSLVLIGACLCGCAESAAPAQPGPARPPVVMDEGTPWTVDDVTYTVTWVTLPHGYGGDPAPHVEINVHVDNHGKNYAHFPDPSAVYDGGATAVAGWTQPPSGAEIAPGHTADFRSSFPLRMPGGTLRVRVLAFTGDVEELGYWIGTVHSG
ncbi:hypothetical protein [Amycolatopsis taiwanensis]|uniref:DUF4352 domain-containing protein n=1 Tax=Amycolatopsis taiwanensis TaxID=342230 RepID=A0A9W6R1F2_9PSEU|nr:hypothetical protein [Amycolatopsis taiwanensis]GLY67804.1 hypothetical protein Atai01_44230 [Amycolatopsis taiwanensis]